MANNGRVQIEDWHETRLMVRVATLFYKEELTQAEISQQLSLSPARVSRLIKKARNQGIVNIQINDLLPFKVEEERFLEKTFNLREVIVVPRDDDDEQITIQNLGKVAGERLIQAVRGNMIIGIGQGTTMRSVVYGLKGTAVTPQNITVVPMFGGLTYASPDTNTNFLAREMATALGGVNLEMFAPTLADTPYNRNIFMSDSSIFHVLAKARAADVIITGIGEVSETSRLISLCSYSHQEMEQLHEDGAVGEIGSNFYNADGKPCSMEFNYRVVGLTFEEIAQAPLVIGVAGGDKKLEAIRGILKSKVLDILITDDVTAKNIRESEEKKNN